MHQPLMRTRFSRETYRYLTAHEKLPFSSTYYCRKQPMKFLLPILYLKDFFLVFPLFLFTSNERQWLTGNLQPFQSSHASFNVQGNSEDCSVTSSSHSWLFCGRCQGLRDSTRVHRLFSFPVQLWAHWQCWRMWMQSCLEMLKILGLVCMYVLVSGTPQIQT